MLSVHKNSNEANVPAPKTHDKKFVVRTYAMDVAVAQQKMHGVAGAPTTSGTLPIPQAPPAPTQRTNVLIPPKPPIAKENEQTDSEKISTMPASVDTTVSTQTKAQTSTHTIPPAPAIPMPQAPTSVTAPSASTDAIHASEKYRHTISDTPPPISSKPQTIKESTLSPLMRHKTVIPVPSTFTKQQIPQKKQRHALLSKLTKRKEAPEIPIDLMITHRDQTVDHESTLAKTWTWLTGKSGEVTHDKTEIHENIVVPQGNSIGRATQSFPAETDIGKPTQDAIHIFNQEQMPGTQTASLKDAVMVPIRQSKAPKPAPEMKPIEKMPYAQMETPVATEVSSPIVDSATPSVATSPVVPMETPVVPAAPTSARPVQQDTAPQTSAELVRQAYKDLEQAQAMTQEVEDNTPAPEQSFETRTTAHTQPESRDPTISPLHTYRMDVADTIKETGASTTSILARQQNAQTLTPASSSQSEKEKRILLWFAIGGALLFILSIVGAGYAYQYHARKVAPARMALPVPSLVPANTTTELSGAGIVLLGELSHVAKTPLQNGMIKTVYIATSTIENNGVIEKRPLPGGYLIAAMGLPMPAILMNNTAVDSTVGVVGADNQTYPFFILRVASYDSAFAGMLRWESSLASDMRTLYPNPAESAPKTTNATSTKTQTLSENIQALSSSASFVDETVANHNVRILQNSAGQSILLYGFANKHTLIIARNAAAFTVLLGKLGQQ